MAGVASKRKDFHNTGSGKHYIPLPHIRLGGRALLTESRGVFSGVSWQVTTKVTVMWSLPFPHICRVVEVNMICFCASISLPVAVPLHTIFSLF